jgi:hypothetical protein
MNTEAPASIVIPFKILSKGTDETHRKTVRMKGLQAEI